MERVDRFPMPSSANKERDASKTRKGKKALALLDAKLDSLMSRAMVASHENTEALRRFAERIEDRVIPRWFDESAANFELDQESGEIHVAIYDSVHGHWDIRMTPEEVEKGLKELEETEDNQSSLSSFFMDIKF